MKTEKIIYEVWVKTQRDSWLRVLFTPSKEGALVKYKELKAENYWKAIELRVTISTTEVLYKYETTGVETKNDGNGVYDYFNETMNV